MEKLEDAVQLHRAGQIEEAARRYREILGREPENIGALYYLGLAGLQAGEFAEAERLSSRLLDLNAKMPDVYLLRGGILQSLDRPDEALECYATANAIDPRRADSYFESGRLLLSMGRLDEARNAFRSVLALEPNNVDARINLAIALSRLNCEKEALAQFDAVLRAAPGHVEALYNRATLLSVMGRFEEAVSDCKKVLITSPDFDYALGTYVWSKLQCCDWNGIDEARSRIESGLAAGKKVLNPQQYVGIATSSESLLRCARLWVANEYPPDASPLWRGERYDHERIRVGYLSADFHAHATAYLMAGIFKNHDRSRFETIAVSHGPNDGGAMRQRLEGAFDRFIAAEEKSDAEIARLVRESEIDILVDLKGYTQGARTSVLAQRPAPLQISYLGYPGTTGAGYIDYVLADATVIPPEDIPFYSEQVVWLADSYQCNDVLRAFAGEPPGRAEAGLPGTGIVLCCFNANYKILPETFDLWMKILSGVPESVLWLLEPGEAAMRNLWREGEERGVSAERIIFAPPLGHDEHLSRLRLADLMLDTLPYNAHTTASDSLRAGVPVLTRAGATFAGRVAASLLNAIDLPELIATGPEDYLAAAIALASNREALAALKAKLARNVVSRPLFDSADFTRKLEAAYSVMHQRQREGLAPASFAVGA